MIPTRIRSFPAVHALALAAAAFWAGAAPAAELAREGDFSATYCFVGNSATLVESKTDLAFSFELTGPVRAETPGSFLDMTSVHCVGLGEIKGGTPSGTHRCQFMDADGDRVFARFQAAGPKTTLEISGGTGKYAGISGAGETQSPVQVQPGPAPFR
ncbi:MAG: hypothetical protein SCH98_07750 [Deferrisomatales bacterium]|nr:hypothetical protein [Deferrisomatales bacterium]